MRQLSFILLFLSGTLFASPAKQIQIIPYPAEIIHGEGVFRLSGNFTIEAKEEIQFEADYLADILKRGSSDKPAGSITNKTIKLQLNEECLSQLGREGYFLSTSSEHIIIRAATPAGVFYGIQTNFGKKIHIWK